MSASKTLRFGPLDGLRGIAVLIVFLSHTSGREIYLSTQLNFAGIGHIGVYLFFCLSAYFLATRLFEEGIYSKSVKRFYIKRVLRILPLYYLVLLLVFLLQEYGGVYDERYLHIKNGTEGFLQHLFLYRGDSVFWSVVVEEQFYLLVPLWIYLFLRFKIWAVIGFASLGLVNFILYMCKYLYFPIQSDAIKYLTTNNRSSGNYIDIFIFTIIIVYFFHHYRPFFERHKKRIIGASTIAFIGLMTYTVYAVSMNIFGAYRPNYYIRYISLMYTVVFTFFILSVVMGNQLNKYLNWTWLRKVGIYGFSIYLLHFPIFQVINLFELHHTLKFFIAAPVVFVVSMLTYKFIEKPSIKLSYRLIKRFNLNED